MEEFSCARFKTDHFEPTTDIPDWFDLNNYRATNKLTHKQWRHQFESRFCFLYQVTAEAEINSLDYGILEEVRIKGTPKSIHTAHDYTELVNSGRTFYSEIKNYAIRPLSILNIAFDGKGLFEPLTKNKIKVPDEYIDNHFDMPFDIYRKDHEDDPNRETLAYLVIDLKLPISDIVTEVKKFIPEYRKLLGINPNPMVPSDKQLGS